jgi:hypothetical protein
MAKVTVGRVLDQATDSVEVAQGDASVAQHWPVRDFNKLVPEEFDFIEVTTRNLAGDPTVIEYRTGGSGGTIVATLTLLYDVNDDFESVERT